MPSSQASSCWRDWRSSQESWNPVAQLVFLFFLLYINAGLWMPVLLSILTSSTRKTATPMKIVIFLFLTYSCRILLTMEDKYQRIRKRNCVSEYLVFPYSNRVWSGSDENWTPKKALTNAEKLAWLTSAPTVLPKPQNKFLMSFCCPAENLFQNRQVFRFLFFYFYFLAKNIIIIITRPLGLKKKVVWVGR